MHNQTTVFVLYDLDFSKNAEYILVSSNEGLFLINKDSNETLQYTNELWKGYISANGEFIVAMKGKNITLFNNKSSTPLWNYTSDRATIGYLSISENGDFFLTREFNQTANYPYLADYGTYLFSKEVPHKSLHIPAKISYLSHPKDTPPRMYPWAL